MSKVRINDLAREMEVKSRRILDVLAELGLDAGKTHSSSLEEYEAVLLKQNKQCFICGSPPQPNRNLCVDHKHIENFEDLPREEKRKHSSPQVIASSIPMCVFGLHCNCLGAALNG